MMPTESLIPKHIEKIYAGKSCHHHHMTQEEINNRLVMEAKKGKIVARLKGGTPFIFGRGGEEMEYIVQQGIDFTIIPGVNAADGCSAYCGIPLTHRDLANNVRFFTGHEKKNKELELDWKSLADVETTLVIYMGLVNLETIVSNLIKYGLPPETPAAAIQNGTMPNARACITDLKNLYQETRDFGSPTLIIVGRVVALAREVAI